MEKGACVDPAHSIREFTDDRVSRARSPLVLKFIAREVPRSTPRGGSPSTPVEGFESILGGAGGLAPWRSPPEACPPARFVFVKKISAFLRAQKIVCVCIGHHQ